MSSINNKALGLNAYQIKCRAGRAIPTGKYERTRRGNLKPVLTYAEMYDTPAGMLSPGVWKEKAMAAVRAENKTDLLEKVKKHCENHCAWLHGEDEIEEYALSCICSYAYKSWSDFEL